MCDRPEPLERPAPSAKFFTVCHEQRLVGPWNCVSMCLPSAPADGGGARLPAHLLPALRPKRSARLVRERRGPQLPQRVLLQRRRLVSVAQMWRMRAGFRHTGADTAKPSCKISASMHSEAGCPDALSAQQYGCEHLLGRPYSQAATSGRVHEDTRYVAHPPGELDHHRHKAPGPALANRATALPARRT